MSVSATEDTVNSMFVTINRIGLAVTAAVLLISCATAPSSTMAQSGTDIRVLVMGEDSDPKSVKRSSDIFKRVLAELKGSMQRYGFRMVDEESVAVNLGWVITERRPKTELLEAAKLANMSTNAANHVRAMVLFRIHAFKQDLSFSTKVQVRLDGEIYDVRNNVFLGTFEIPRATYPAPADCNAGCLSEVVGDHAREIATSLGDVLGKKLDRLTIDPGRDNRMASTGDGLINTYTLTFRHFTTPEVMSIIGVMSEEFPEYSAHNLISKRSAVRRYEYVSGAKPGKIEEWLTILLMDMGFDVDRDIDMIMTGNEVILEKLVVDDSGPTKSEDVKRFN